nr:speckle targeted PIP5K1A-regulated poly(A) polymerase-like isoform X1 [Lytechinus pictus]
MEHDTISSKGKSFHCDICIVKIMSGKAVEDHLQGKKHQRLIAIQASRQKQAECSIFVGGLTKLVSELELTDYFSKFGPVAQVIVDKDKGKYAIVEFSQRDDAERASEEEKQKMNGKKITVRPREHKPLTLKGKQQTSAGKKAKTARDKEMENILEGLLEAEDVSSQMIALVEETCLDQPDLQLRYLICDLLQEVFVEMFPKCRVFPYGSSVSRFGVKGCDLDLQIDLGQDDQQYKYKFASMFPNDDVMDTNEEMDAGPSNSDVQSSEEPDTSKMTHEDILQVLCRLLKQCVPSCQHVRVIPSSRRPVIKFIHKESSLHCDLSLDNRLALRNTELLHFYSLLDDRIRPLICCLRQWSKHHQLSGNPQGPGPRLTNYALTLLVIHYLQNTQPPLLPTIHQLKELAGPDKSVILGGWDCSFTTDPSKFSCRDNTESLESLMKGFFCFYTKCDFATSVLCPVSGTIIPLTQFKTQMTPDSSSSKEFKVGPFNIQDPLELTHNVAMNVNDKIAVKMREELRKASLTCISLRYRKQGEDPETGKIPRWGLLSLLEERDGGRKKAEGGASVVIPLKMSQVTPEFIKQFEDARDMKWAWCQHAEKFAMGLIEDVLGILCSEESQDDHTTEMEDGVHSLQPPQEMIEHPESSCSNSDCHTSTTKDIQLRDTVSDEDIEPSRKRQRISSNLDDDDDEHEMSMTSSSSMNSPAVITSPGSSTSPATNHDGSTISKVIQCKAMHNVWVGRRKLRRKLQTEKPWGDAPIDELSKEKLVTHEIMKSSTTPSTPLTEFKIEFRRKLAADCTLVIIAFHTSNNDVNAKNFAHFYDEFVARMLCHLKV